MAQAQKLKFSWRSEWPAWALLAAALVSAWFFYQNFPETVATHWNLAGEADGWSSPGFAAFFFPGLIAVLYLLFLWLPRLDPKSDKYPEFARAYHAMKNMLVGFMVAVYWLTGLNGLGFNLPINIYVPMLIGLMFIILGVYLPELKPNWFIGIRTPWTLSSPQVWKKTHQHASKWFVACGILMLGTGLVPKPWQFIFFLSLAIGSSLWIIGYSYWLHRRLRK